MSTTQSKNKKKDTSGDLSGLSIALAFITLGASYAYWLKDTYGAATPYVAGVLTLIGAVGLLIELGNMLKHTKLRLANGGIGLVLLTPTVIGAYYVNLHTDGPVRSLIIFALSLVAIFGLAGLIDLFVSMAEDAKNGNSILSRIPGVLKLTALAVTSGASIVVSIQQFF